jgi:hypothetical protein
MRRSWIVVLTLTPLWTAGLLWPTHPLASAQEAVKHSQVAAVRDGASNRDLPTDPTLHYVSHELCGIGLGGYCPGRYRACVRAGRPQAECQARLARCEECNHAMLNCRQKVGHQAGYTCAQCRKALDQCRAQLSAPSK